jgi:hypothetical protein
VNAVAGLDPARPGMGVDPFVALVGAAAVLAVAVFLGVWRLGRFEVSEAG